MCWNSERLWLKQAESYPSKPKQERAPIVASLAALPCPPADSLSPVACGRRSAVPNKVRCRDCCRGQTTIAPCLRQRPMPRLEPDKGSCCGSPYLRHRFRHSPVSSLWSMRQSLKTDQTILPDASRYPDPHPTRSPGFPQEASPPDRGTNWRC